MRTYEELFVRSIFLGEPLPSFKRYLREVVRKNKVKRPRPPMSEERKQQIGDLFRGKLRSKETKQKMSDSHKEKWKDPKYAQRMLTFLSQRSRPNKLEVCFDNLQRSHLVWPLKINTKCECGMVGTKIPDFVCHDRKKIIEIYGCYFHACPICYPTSTTS